MADKKSDGKIIADNRKARHDYFVEEMENLLFYTFELKEKADIVGADNTDEKRLLYTCIIAAVRKVYLEKCLEAIAQET